MERKKYLAQISRYLRVQPVCAMLGARQVGKTTLARQFAQQYQGEVEFFDLENPTHLASLQTPLLTLGAHAGKLIVIDEIQRRPDLFPVIRVLVDDPNATYTFLILGSASRDLIPQSSETLAGRIGYIELPPFTLEVAVSEQLLVRGGFPRSYLAGSDGDSFLWREEYITTFLERDLPSFGFDISTQLMHRLWMMLCFYHGQILNASAIASSLMLSDKTVSKYIDILAGTFMIRVLQPWYENIQKRQVRRPKIYFRDSGIFNVLAGLRSAADLRKTPQLGALWEGFAVEQIIMALQVRQEQCYFWSTHNDAELDLLIFKDGKRLGFECKYTDSPKMTKSMHRSLADLKLDHLYLICPEVNTFPLSENVMVYSLETFVKKVVQQEV